MKIKYTKLYPNQDCVIFPETNYAYYWNGPDKDPCWITGEMILALMQDTEQRRRTFENFLIWGDSNSLDEFIKTNT